MFCKDYFLFSNISYDKSGCIAPLFHTGNEFHPFSLCLSLSLRERDLRYISICMTDEKSNI